MRGENFYLIGALPSLPILGEEPPFRADELLAHVAGRPRPHRLVATMYLSHDLILRDALVAGEIDQAEPIVLTPDQLRDEAPLPEDLTGGEASEDATGRVGSDAMWEAYFRHAAATAAELGSKFLSQWVGHEVALRNALAEARARALALEPANYLVAVELAGEHDFSALIAQWSSAATPLAGLRALDTARWTWLSDHDQWFTYSDDEMVAYAARLILLDRWYRLTIAEQQPAEAAGPISS